MADEKNPQLPLDGGTPPANPSHVPINIEEEMRRSYLDYSMSFIIGRALPDEAILVDRSTGLSILPSTSAGDVDTITELMFSERIVDVLDHLRHRYEMIVIDSPPLVPLVDGRARSDTLPNIPSCRSAFVIVRKDSRTA